jgi:hypothetical protein
MTDLRTLMMDVILPNLGHIPNAVIYVKQLLELDKFVKKKQFTGEIHCEATMMALIHSLRPRRHQSMSTHIVRLPICRPLFSVIMSLTRFPFVTDVFPLGSYPSDWRCKKSCLCCYWLGGLLQSDTQEPFTLPGTHGIIFPWTPPVFGINVPVLEKLQQKLISKLTEVTETWIGRHPPPWHSNRQSSPADFEDDVDW